MAFGSRVTDFPQSAIGLFGYTLKIDLTSLLFHKVTEVQAQIGPSNTPEPFYTEEKLATVQSYLNNPNCPRLAFNYSDGNVTIFCKEDGTDIPAWVGATMYEAGDFVQGDIGGDAALFQAANRGFSGSVEQTWSEGTVVDGDVSWTFVKYIPFNDGFPYAATTRFAVMGLRKAQPAVDDSDYLDFPDKDADLVKAYVIGMVWLIKKKLIPLNILNQIKSLEFKITNE
jgi:hypothetical protein